MPNPKEQAEQQLAAHAKALDDLHQNLSGLQGMDKEKLQQAAAKYKAAHRAFHDDALGCMN